MAVIILADSQDGHAVVFAWGLRKLGVEVDIWDGLTWKAEGTATVIYSHNIDVYLGSRKITDQDTIWFRRPARVVMHPDTHVDDYKYATDEYRAFDQALLMQLELTGARCINKWSVASRLEEKTIQLSIARKVGLLFPSTVMTNTASQIPISYMEENRKWVHKSFLPHVWLRNDIRRYAKTSSLKRGLATFKAEIFSYAPGIYQERVQKQFDVRVVMFGKELHAFCIDTKDSSNTDWRPEFLLGKASVRRIDVPEETGAKLHHFAKIAGLVHGSFDFVVDLESRWWFLEVNQSGQILWIDDSLPMSGTFQPMLEFLSFGQKLKKTDRNDYPTYTQSLVELILPDDRKEITAETKYVTLEK